MKAQKKQTETTKLSVSISVSSVCNSMRHWIIILISTLPLTIFGQLQKQIRILNGATHKPVKEIDCYILKDNDEWIDIRQTNKMGILTTSLLQFDTSSTYQISITEEGFIPLIQSIDPFDRKTLTVNLFPDSRFRKKRPELIYSTCSSTSFGFYKPKEPHSIYDLPDSIRFKLVSHLVRRLGLNFYSKLKIECGQIVDLDRLYIVDDAKNYKWTPYSYYLCFSFQDVSKGIGLYTAQIVLDKYGNVVQEIELPYINSNPEKAKIISLKQAKAIAKENKCYDKRTEITISYNKTIDCIVWSFKQTFLKPDRSTSGWILEIDAHNGNVIDKHAHGWNPRSWSAEINQ